MKTNDWSASKESLIVLASSEEEWMTSYAIGVHLAIPPDKLYRFIEMNRKFGKLYKSSETAMTHIIAKALGGLIGRGAVEKRKISSCKNEYRITEKGRLHLEKLKSEANNGTA